MDGRKTMRSEMPCLMLLAALCLGFPALPVSGEDTFVLLKGKTTDIPR